MGININNYDFDISALITDRTEKDEQRVIYLSELSLDEMSDEEKAEWSGGLKGAYNASDLNRVESAVKYLASILRELVPELKEYSALFGVAWDADFDTNFDTENLELETKTSWNEDEIPCAEDVERFLANVKLLKSSINYATTELPKSMNDLTWRGANAIEEALKRLDSAIIAFRSSTMTKIENTSNAWFYSDEIYAGEVMP